MQNLGIDPSVPLTQCNSPSPFSFPQSVIVQKSSPNFSRLFCLPLRVSDQKRQMKCKQRKIGKMWKADEMIKRVETRERRSSLLSPSQSLFPTIASLSFNFCGSFVLKLGRCSRISGDPLYCVVVFKQQASFTVDTLRPFRSN